MLRLGVTGTDTGIGKTTVACALLALLRERGVRTAAMKPVETGVTATAPDSDAARLRALATVPHPLSRVRPYRFDEPLAPMAAAESGGVAIAPDELDRAFQALCDSADALVVEGAGGALVPITASLSVADLFRRWSLDVIIVAVNRLGMLNHTLLTERALREAGCSVTGIVIVAPERGDESSVSNGAILGRLTSTPLFHFPWLPDPSDAHALASAARHAGLGALVRGGSPSTVVMK